MTSPFHVIKADTIFGFLDSGTESGQLYNPRLIANEADNTMLRAIREELRRSERFDFSIAFIGSGALGLLKQALHDFKGRGRIITGSYLDFNSPDVFRELLGLKDIEVLVYPEGQDGFHSKGYVFTQKEGITAIVGSSNLTRNALLLNQEWNLRFSALPDGDVTGQIDLSVAWLPMDGFHLADVELERLGLRGRKGVIQTFDGYGYVNTLRRIREGRDPVVYAPAFERDLEQPIAGALPILKGADLVITEGNYLLDRSDPWNQVGGIVDEIWFVDAGDETRHDRLMKRHVRFGKTPRQASDWIRDVDAPNGVRIRSEIARANRVIDSEGEFAERT